MTRRITHKNHHSRITCVVHSLKNSPHKNKITKTCPKIVPNYSRHPSVLHPQYPNGLPPMYVRVKRRPFSVEPKMEKKSKTQPIKVQTKEVPKESNGNCKNEIAALNTPKIKNAIAFKR